MSLAVVLKIFTLTSLWLVNAPFGQLENASTDLLTDITVQKFIKAGISVFGAYGSVSAFKLLTNWLSERVDRRYRLLTKQAFPFWNALVLLVTLSYLINLFFKLSQANVLALTGTIAVALGFAFKDYISSIIAGVVALYEAPYRVGDRVRIGEHYGEVVGYGLRGIRLQTPSDDTVTIPHSKTWTEAISNANNGSLEAQVVTNFYFAHGIDVERVMQILYQAAYTSKYTQLKLPILVVIQEQPWGTHFKLKAYPMDARDEFVYQTDLLKRAKQALNRYELNYPLLPFDRSFN